MMRQRGIAARDSKAKRGEFGLCCRPPSAGMKLASEIDPDEHVAGVIRLVFAKFRELSRVPTLPMTAVAPTSRCPSCCATSRPVKLAWKGPSYQSRGGD